MELYYVEVEVSRNIIIMTISYQQGPYLPTTGVSTTAGSPEGSPWTNPGNITADDGSLATASISFSADFSPYLKGTGFGFNLPSTATVTGIILDINRRKDAFDAIDNTVKIVKGGTVVGDNKASGTSYPASLTVASYGGVSDLWGTTWAYTDINASNFGAVLSFTQNGSSSAGAAVDSFKITVVYTDTAGSRGFFF